MTGPAIAAPAAAPDDRFTDEEWGQIERLLPPPKTRHRNRIPDRTVFSAALWVGLTGQPWSALPEPLFCKENTARNRLSHLGDTGILAGIFGHLPTFKLRRSLRRALERSLTPFLPGARHAEESDEPYVARAARNMAGGHELHPGRDELHPARDDRGTDSGRTLPETPQNAAVRPSRLRPVAWLQTLFFRAGRTSSRAGQTSLVQAPAVAVRTSSPIAAAQPSTTTTTTKKTEKDLGEAVKRAAGRSRRTTVRFGKEGVSISMPEVMPLTAMMNRAPKAIVTTGAVLMIFSVVWGFLAEKVFPGARDFWSMVLQPLLQAMGH